jgi:ATP-binding cassette, subfamily B (MDR/TAP), member 1
VPKIRSREGAIIPHTFDGIFEFKKVLFAYPKDKQVPVLRNLSITIDGRNSALMGKSGCGKSTIFQLIMRFYDPDEGAVYLDGIDIRDLDLDWLRSQIGFVKQEPTLFSTTIR